VWYRIPGVDQADVQRWQAMAQADDGMKALADAINRQSASPQAPAQPGTPPAPAPPPAPAQPGVKPV
jgi:hypothetical protein